MKQIPEEKLFEEKILDNVSGGGSEEVPSQMVCPICGSQISLRAKKGLFNQTKPGVCKCGFKVGEKWL